jgi:plastocyanin
MGCAETILQGELMTALWLVLLLGTRGELVPKAAVEIRTFQLNPPVLEVTAGTTVIWTNQDQIEHTVSGGVPDGILADFGGTLPGKGSSFGVTFDRAGTYHYFCARHSFMRGEIRVLTPNDGAH